MEVLPSVSVRTPEMLQKARANAKKDQVENVFWTSASVELKKTWMDRRYRRTLRHNDLAYLSVLDHIWIYIWQFLSPLSQFCYHFSVRLVWKG